MLTHTHQQTLTNRQSHTHEHRHRNRHTSVLIYCDTSLCVFVMLLCDKLLVYEALSYQCVRP